MLIQSNRLQVVSEPFLKDFGTYRKLMVKCQCRCGGIVTVRKESLASGNVKSCGCLHKEFVSKLGKSAVKHGEFADGKQGCGEYFSWHNLKERCLNKNDKDYAKYGGRGITVCNKWKESYQNFLADMGRRPEGYSSIDRINVNGNYEPSNCRWSTYKQQSNNRRVSCH